ncbi:MAG: tetratricopeptide repeat protein, partial [Nitrospinae bacterium]|nr:tetratricopeptide repeat protein [Nitrospinota bacterium]
MYTVTFYSYKGGVGRTLALVNTAYALATESNAKVVAVDFDLEAPGIDVIPPFNEIQTEKGGIVEYIAAYSDREKPDPQKLPSLKPYASKVKGVKNLTLIPAGRKDGTYQENLCKISWQELYKNKRGFDFFENLKKKIEEEFNPDYLLIDSRTGLADIAGITTHQLAEMIVLIFNLNSQNILGAEKAYMSFIHSGKPIKTLLVASPIPKGQFLDDTILKKKLKEVEKRMPRAINSGKDSKDKVILVPYEPVLALDDILFTQKHPSEDLAKEYKAIAGLIEKNNPSDFRAKINKALELQEQERYKEAEFALQHAIKERPQEAKGYFYYGNLLMELGKFNEAEENYQRATELDVKNVEYLSSLATAQTRNKNLPLALETLQKAENISPENVSLLERIANLHYRLEQNDKYKDYLTKAQKLQLPLTSNKEISPTKLFNSLYPRFFEAKLDFPKDFNRNLFWKELKEAVGLDFKGKSAIIIGCTMGTVTYFQAKQLLEIIRKETNDFSKVLGKGFKIVKDKLKEDELESIKSEKSLKTLLKNINANEASPFHYFLSQTLREKKKYQESLKHIDLCIQRPSEKMDLSELYQVWGNICRDYAKTCSSSEEKVKQYLE